MINASRSKFHASFSASIFILLVSAGLYSPDAAAQKCCGESFGVLVSATPNRAGADILDGATVSGDIHVFVTPPLPSSSIKKVKWFIDDSVNRPNIFFIDQSAPYDFQGGSVALANSFDTTTLADGEHVIHAQIVFNGSPRVREIHTSTFTVNNFGPPPPPPSGSEFWEFGISDTPDRLDAAADMMPDPFAPALELLFGQVFIFLGESSTCNLTNCIPVTDPQVPPPPAILTATWTFDIGTPEVLPVNTDNAAPFDIGAIGVTDDNPTNLGFNLDALPEGIHTLTATLTFASGPPVDVTRTFISQPLIATLPPTLIDVPVPMDDQLLVPGPIIADLDAAIALGRAFYWDLQTGGDGRQACATCHYHAGADNRILNTLTTGANGVFDAFTNPGATLGTGDFNFFQFADILNRNSAIINNIDDVVGSQGLFQRDFAGIDVGNPTAQDFFTATVVPDLRFVDSGGTSHRRVTGRNTPTNINAIFNVRSFWDGRANFVFNGQNPFGARDTGARVYGNDGASGAPPVAETLRVLFSSLASQAVGPPLDGTEMSYAGRTFPELGKKLMALVPLAKQTIHPDDSIFGTPGALGGGDGTTIGSGAGIIAGGGMGLDAAHSYELLIKAAFKPRYWNGGTVDIDGVTFEQIEANFAMFWGLAVQLWEATLVSDNSPWDHFRKGTPAEQQAKLDFALASIGGADSTEPDVLTAEEAAGMLSFLGGSCNLCHAGPVLSAATVPFLLGPVPAGEPAEQVVERMLMEQGIGALELGLPPLSKMYDFGFYNIGIRPTTDDPGVGGTDPFGNPLSFSSQLRTGLHVDDGLNAGDPGILAVDSCFFVRDPCGSTIGLPIAVNGAFKVPSLRNVELTAPYMHTGGHLTLTDVIAFYARGADFALDNIVDLDPEVAGIGNLRGNPAGVAALRTFLGTFTDPNVRAEAGKFDHPSLLLENGVVVEAVGIAGHAALPTLIDRLKGPTANVDRYETPVDVNLTGENVLANDTDGTGDTPGDAFLIDPPLQGPHHGALIAGGLMSDGSFTYEPGLGFRGVDSFAYDMATDNTADPRSNVARVTIQVGDEVPVANPDAYSTDVDTPLVVLAAGAPEDVLFNDTDDFGPLEAHLVAGPTHGALTVPLALDGHFTYTPDALFTGMDSFTYTANDPGGPSNVATVTIDVVPDVAPCPVGGNTLCYSLTSDRSAPLLLGGAKITGTVFVFLSPEIPTSPAVANIKQGIFWIDIAGALKGPTKFSKDKVAPYDLAGSASASVALPFSANSLADGVHTIRAGYRLLSDGSLVEVPSATFTVE